MSSSRQSTLLAALQRKPVPASPESPAAPPKRGASKQAPPPPPRRSGKPVQFWLREDDRKLIRELAAWLAGQGVRPTDSLVVRAALRMARVGPAYLEAHRQAAALDGRLRP